MRIRAPIALGVFLLASSAHAAGGEDAVRGELDAPSNKNADGPAAAPQPWLYLDDPTTPRPMAVTAHTRATYTNTSASAKPFALDLAHRGAVLEAGADVGILPALALTATGYGSAGDGRGGAIGGVRLALFPAGSSTRVVLGGGAMRELGGAAGVWGSAAFEQELGRARVGATVRMSHAFANGRDAVDTVASAGASYAVLGPLRAGVEWVGTDLEGAVDQEEAEGGVRHFVGPTASVELLERRLSLVGGPAFGLSHAAPSLLGRIGAAYTF